MALEKALLMEQETQLAPPCVFVLFGATGDLTAKKIAPAIYNLAANGMIGEQFAVLGLARKPRTDEQFRNEMLEAVRKYSRTPPVDEIWNNLARRWHYIGNEASTEDEYRQIDRKLRDMDAAYGTQGSRLFYLALPPTVFPTVIGHLEHTGMNMPSQDRGFVRLVIEKPFGSDLESAKRLNQLLLGTFQESQIYRIDHFLGKETAQNLLVFRFANSIFQPLFDRRLVDHVEITAAETVGMEGRRGAYYETAGAMRDMVQNHMLQLLALTAMESPACIRCDEIREAKAKLLQAIELPSPQEVARWTVRGQYRGYRQEQGVDANSQVETYAAVRLFVDNARWHGVPFYLRTGKKLAAKTSQVILVFKREPGRMLEDLSCELRSPNRLCMQISPDEGIWLTFDAKVPGVQMMLRPVRMEMKYGSTFASASPEAYEQLLLDAAKGDSTLFIRNDEVEASWRVVDAIRGAWESTAQPPLELYEPLSWGPENADRIFNDPYKHWQSG